VPCFTIIYLPIYSNPCRLFISQQADVVTHVCGKSEILPKSDFPCMGNKVYFEDGKMNKDDELAVISGRALTTRRHSWTMGK
jgi:hypothetical protein